MTLRRDTLAELQRFRRDDPEGYLAMALCSSEPSGLRGFELDLQSMRVDIVALQREIDREESRS